MSQDDKEPGEREGKGEAATDLDILIFAEAAVLSGGLPCDGGAGRKIRALHGERQQEGQSGPSDSTAAAAAALVDDVVATPAVAAEWRQQRRAPAAATAAGELSHELPRRQAASVSVPHEPAAAAVSSALSAGSAAKEATPRRPSRLPVAQRYGPLN